MTHRVYYVDGRYYRYILVLQMANDMAGGMRDRVRRLCNKINIVCYKEGHEMAPDNASGIM